MPSLLSSGFLVAVLLSAFPSTASSTPLSATLFKIGSMYTSVVARAPTTVHCLQGSAVSALGDATSQWIERKHGPKAKLKKKKKAVFPLFAGKKGDISAAKPRMNGGRLMRASAIGLLVNGLLLPAYYTAIQGRLPGRDPASVALKVVFDGAVWGFMGNGALITARLAMEGTPWGEAFAIAKKEIPGVFRSDLCTWTTYNSLCYGVIPSGLQPISTAVMSTLWGAYLSFVSVGTHPQPS